MNTATVDDGHEHAGAMSLKLFISTYVFSKDHKICLLYTSDAADE